MPIVRLEISRHHNVEAQYPAESLVFPKGECPYVHALMVLMRDHFDQKVEYEALSNLEAEGKITLSLTDEYGDEGTYTFWWETELEEPNIGVGPGKANDKYENYWAHVREYQKEEVLAEALGSLADLKLKFQAVGFSPNEIESLERSITRYREESQQG